MFGLIAAWLVIRTGGLEAGIALHVLNNYLAFGFAIAFTDLDSALDPGEVSWWNIPVTLTQSLVYAVLVLWLAKRMKVQQTTRPPALDEPAARTLRRGLHRLGVRHLSPRPRFWSDPAGRVFSTGLRRKPTGLARGPHPMGYGVIGSPTGSGPVSLGSSPSTPANDESLRCRAGGRVPDLAGVSALR